MLSNVGIASLTGGPANATFTLSGWSGTTSIAAGSGTNALVVAAGSVPTTSLTVSNVQNLNVTGGTLDVNASFKSIPTVNVLSAGTLELDNGVTLTANVSNAGILTLGGPTNIARATLSGNYVQQSSGVLDIKLGGTAAGQFDQLNVTGNATLAGTLAVSLVGGFTPQSGDSFQIITYMGALIGDFTTKQFPAPGYSTSSGSGVYTVVVS